MVVSKQTHCHMSLHDVRTQPENLADSVGPCKNACSIVKMLSLVPHSAPEVPPGVVHIIYITSPPCKALSIVAKAVIAIPAW